MNKKERMTNACNKHSLKPVVASNFDYNQIRSLHSSYQNLDAVAPDLHSS